MSSYFSKDGIATFKSQNRVAICEFLLSHESDIALGANDFGTLKDFFEMIFLRTASVDPIESRASKLG